MVNAKISNDDIIYVLRSLAAFFKKIQDSDCPEEILLAALELPFYEFKWSVAKSPSATEKVLLNLIRTEKDKQIRKAVVKNPNVTEKVLLKVLETVDNDYDFDCEVPELVATSEMATEKVLMEALKIKHNEVRSAVVKNPNVTENVLIEALKDESTARYALSSDKVTEKVFLKAVEDFKFCKLLFLEGSFGLSNDSRLTNDVLEKALDLHGSKRISWLKSERMIFGGYTDKHIDKAFGYAIYNHPNASEELKKKAKKYLWQ